MNYQDLFPIEIQQALTKEEPGSWIPKVPARVIRLHAGYPAAAVVPADSLAESVRILVREERDQPLQYLGSKQMQILPQWILRRLTERGMNLDENQLLVTSGAAQAIDLCARILLDPHSCVAVESPTYMEALEMFRNYTDDIIEIPLDEDGLNPDALENILRRRQQSGQSLPKFLYIIPSFHNPTGTCLTTSRRKRLLQLANEYNFLIVEDDAYGELYFEEPPRTLKSLDEHERVIYLGSLSKVLAPGLRIGWAAGPAPIIRAMAWFKKDLDQPFMQAAVATYLEISDWAWHLSQLRSFYGRQRDVMLRAMQEQMPSQVKWFVPKGGYFLWVQTVGIDTNDLSKEVLERGVSFIPGKYFYQTPSLGREFLRLSYSYVGVEDIVHGVNRLAEVLQSKYG